MNFLRSDDVATLGDVALCGSFIARRVFEEARNAEVQFKEGEFHFAKETAIKLVELSREPISLSGCWNINHKSAHPTLVMGAHETLQYFDLFSQIIHVDPLQLWKSGNEKDPSFWFASPEHNNHPKRNRFYRMSWSRFGGCLSEVANRLDDV